MYDLTENGTRYLNAIAGGEAVTFRWVVPVICFQLSFETLFYWVSSKGWLGVMSLQTDFLPR